MLPKIRIMGHILKRIVFPVPVVCSGVNAQIHDNTSWLVAKGFIFAVILRDAKNHTCELNELQNIRFNLFKVSIDIWNFIVFPRFSVGYCTLSAENWWLKIKCISFYISHSVDQSISRHVLTLKPQLYFQCRIAFVLLMNVRHSFTKPHAFHALSALINSLCWTNSNDGQKN